MGRRRTAHLGKITLAAIFCAVGLTAVASHYWTSYRVDRDVAELRELVAVLAREDPAYARLEVVRSTHPMAWIFGTLDSPGQAAALRARVAETFGAEEAGRIVSQVRLPRPATTRSATEALDMMTKPSIPNVVAIQTPEGEHLGFVLFSVEDGAGRGECVFVVVPRHAGLIDLSVTRSLLARKDVGESVVEVVSGSPPRVRMRSAGLPDLELELDVGRIGTWRELPPETASGRTVAMRRD